MSNRDDIIHEQIDELNVKKLALMAEIKLLDNQLDELHSNLQDVETQISNLYHDLENG